MKKVSISILAAFILFIFSSLPVSSATYNASVTFSESNPIPLNLGLAGYNLLNMGTGYNYNDTNFIDQVKNLSPGYLRWPGGTASVAYDWREGRMDAESIPQFYPSEHAYRFLLNNQRSIDGAKYQNLMEFKKLADAVGAKMIITVNGTTDKPESAYSLAKFCRDNNIKVEYWQLVNEPYSLWIGRNTESAHFFKNGFDYAKKMKSFNDSIKNADPNAKTILFCENKADTWNDGIKNYRLNNGRYWDAATFHVYSGFGDTSAEQKKGINTVLDSQINEIIADIKDANGSDIDIVNTEYNLPNSSILRDTMYNGIFNAEYLLRMSKNPNVKFSGMHQLIGTALAAKNTAKSSINLAFENGTQFDTLGYDFQFYNKSVGLTTKLVNAAISDSTNAFTTTVSGGATVQKSDGTSIPALYAQAYKAKDASKYVLITNKSPDTHNVKIYKAGDLVTNSKTVKYVYSTDYTADNTNANPSLLTINTESAGDTVTVRPYSVVLVHWDNPNSPNLAPQTAPMLLSADTMNTDTGVTLKWTGVPLADSYVIKYGTASGTYPSQVTVSGGTTTTYNVTGLSTGTDYYFTIRAKNVNGESGNSNEVIGKGGVPVKPLNISAEGLMNSVRLTWDSVLSARNYKIKYGTSTGNYPNIVDVGNQAGYTFQNLTPGTTYYFVMGSENDAGASTYSSEVSATAQSIVAYSPNNLEITSSTSTTCDLSWQRSPQLKYFETFQDGTSANWSVLSGNWSVVDKGISKQYQIMQSSEGDISICNTAGAFQYDAELNYTVDSWNSTGRIGIVFRYQDANNYYRFVYDNSVGKIKIIKTASGADTVIASKDYSISTTGVMQIKVANNKIDALIDDIPELSVTDILVASTKAGAYSNNQTAWFDKVYMYDKVVSSFKLYRSTSPYTGYSLIASLNNNTYSYSDSGLTSGVTYYYKIKGVDSEGNESRISSNIATK